MGSTNNRYDDEFKEKAIGLVVGGRGVAEAAHDLGISKTALRRWYNESTTPLVTGSDQRIIELEKENKRLNKELSDAKEVADILKKSLGIFART